MGGRDFAVRSERSELLGERTFWAVHYQELMGEAAPVEELFGVSDAEVERFRERELGGVVAGEPDAHRCHCFPMPLPGGCTVVVEYRAHPEDFGIDFFI